MSKRTLIAVVYTLTVVVATAYGKVDISCDYPGGSVIVRGIDETNGVVNIAPNLADTNGRKWMRFDFKVRGAEGRTLHFQFPDDKFNYLATLGPAFSRDGGATWAWLRQDGSRHEPSNAFDWTFAEDERETRFAFCIPYLQGDWEKLAAKYKKRKDVVFGTLCKSQCGERKTELLRLPCRGTAKWLFVFTARHHASEASASFIMEGAIEECLSDSKEAAWLRDNADCVFVPFMDKDGVENGEQGKHRHPHDHNRDYVKNRYTSVRSLKRLLAREGEGKQIVFLDLHSPEARSGKTGHKIHDHAFTFAPIKTAQMDRWQRFRHAWADLQKNAMLKYDGKFDKVDSEKTYADAVKNRSLNSRQYVGSLSNCWLSVCCEFGYSLCDGVYSPDGGRKLGHGLLKAISSTVSQSAPSAPAVVVPDEATTQLELVPMPREVKVSDGECRAVDATKAEVVATIPPEGYELSITPDGVTIRHSDDAGLFYAQMTLKQLLDGAADGALPCVEIKDAPAFRWRGVHLDEARHFFGKTAVKRILDEMSWYKLNVFHWHLTDGQAWVLDVPGYPKLVRQGLGKNFGEKVGPFYYTANDVKEILEYAAKRHITVVPEIDFPGHFAAACRAYPDLACKGGGKVMCVGNTNAVAFAEKVLDYVCELFPSHDIHIGGDECPRKFWAKCPRCRAFVEREGLKDAEDIQPWLTRHLAAYLEAKGRRAIGWEEIVVGRGKADANGESENKDGAKSSLLPEKNVLVMGYHKAAAARSANMGYQVVSCPNWHCYFDYTQQLKDDPVYYFLPDGRWLPLEEVYWFDPFDGVAAESRANIVGGQCCNWTEKTLNLYDLEWKMWPRGLALAEILWTNPDPSKRDFVEFSARAAEHRRRLIREHVNCAPLK